MTTMPKAIAALALALGLAAAAPAAGLAQETDLGLVEALQATDGSPPDAGIALATGWHNCTIERTGAGWGNHYVALTCPSGPFTNKWHITIAAQKDAMLATALSAAVSGKKVQVYIQPASGYNVIRALYLRK